jgi:8-oxo-dGTP diphosphatase
MNSIRLAGCIIRDEAGKILLLHRNKKGVQQWELPGGKLEKGESAEVAATREIREELGVDISDAKHLGGAAFRENGYRFSYEWYEAKIAAGATPSICEPQTFDDMQYWGTDALKPRSDLSANLRNLLSSGTLEPSKKPSYARRMFAVIGTGYLFLALIYALPALLFWDSGETALADFLNAAIVMTVASFAASLIMTALAVHYLMRRRLRVPARIVTIILVLAYVYILYSPSVLSIMSNGGR